jgi:hypothetical protein
MTDREKPRHGRPRGALAAASHGPRGPPVPRGGERGSRNRPLPQASRASTAASSPEKPDGFTRARIGLRPGSHPYKPGKRS